jgi:hypothetical protein
MADEIGQFQKKKKKPDAYRGEHIITVLRQDVT